MPSNLEDSIREHLEAMYLHSLPVTNLDKNRIDPPDTLEHALDMHLAATLLLVRGESLKELEWARDESKKLSGEKWAEEHYTDLLDERIKEIRHG